ncbi:uncharacterized protein B0H18DRAFT_70491 [Fomitopsis serialis]|uniref:uncharacterized protein n=1 Tax=Fomitopsis serialis TaxID=139415 RepID=UPI0020088909|nr:uncharacterized protein B0H18DRAFT_70491 [Neoantrodia serialis]KAH9931922.1 hypothetical protein B0H18DRAFT_70491 [Neoantrodia serialis]
MSRPLELNYSIFGRLSNPRGGTEPVAPATAMSIPELGYADAPSTAGFTGMPPLSKSATRERPSSRPLSILIEETAGQGSHAVSELSGTESRQTIEPGCIYETSECRLTRSTKTYLDMTSCRVKGRLLCVCRMKYVDSM